MTVAQPATARPDLEAHRQVARMDGPQVAEKLVDLLGLSLVAYLGGVKETRAVAGWMAGSRRLRRATEQRLRTALHVALLLATHDSPSIARAWFQGLNPQLDDRAPATLLRDDDIETAGPAVIEAARAFVIGG